MRIESAQDIKITKVESFKVFFDYEGKKFLMHGSGLDFEEWVTLYERIETDNSGQYELKFISRADYKQYFASDFIKYAGKGKVYSQIDKEYFAQQLKEWKFVN